jgi:hypothetical protein
MTRKDYIPDANNKIQRKKRCEDDKLKERRNQGFGLSLRLPLKFLLNKNFLLFQICDSLLH